MTHASHNATNSNKNEENTMNSNDKKSERLTANQVITRAGLRPDATYAHADTGSVMTGREWSEQIREADRETDSAFDPAGDGAHLVEIAARAVSITRVND